MERSTNHWLVSLDQMTLPQARLSLEQVATSIIMCKISGHRLLLLLSLYLWFSRSRTFMEGDVHQAKTESSRLLELSWLFMDAFRLLWLTQEQGLIQLCVPPRLHSHWWPMMTTPLVTWLTMRMPTWLDLGLVELLLASSTTSTSRCLTATGSTMSPTVMIKVTEELIFDLI